MAYFTKEYEKFFKELKKNNNKDWFQENKKRYEEHVRKPMLSLVEDLIQEMQKHDPDIDPKPSKCLSRINRDIRFSKDKTPYNTHMWAHVSKGTKEDPIPGIAFRFSEDEGGIMTGFYQPSKDRLEHIRWKISQNLETFQKLKSDKKFVSLYGSIKGESLKRIPKGLQDIYEKEPLIANKQFYYVKNLGMELAYADDIVENLVEHWLVAKPLNDFFL
ncbi:MAG: DUF2461 domain-containing protein [Flavobacteriales bacterium]|nr:DUF2461 domain-containing protein [Flavobacteriales bacterium]